MNKRFTLRSAVYLLLIKNNKLLIQRRYKTGWMDGRFSLIAGHIEGNETVYSSMVRESKEEAGIDIETSDLKVVHVLHRKSEDDEYIDIFFTAKKWKGEPRIMEKDKSDKMVWTPINSLPPIVLGHVRQVVNLYLKGTFFSEFGFNGEIY